MRSCMPLQGAFRVLKGASRRYHGSMNLLRTLATVSSLTLLSRILGFIRDFVIARAFGAGMATDAFFVAFRLPNLLRRLFAEGAFSQAFVPILAEYRNQRGDDETRPLVVLAHTTKGKGVSFMENSVLWHYRTPQGDEYASACRELDGNGGAGHA